MRNGNNGAELRPEKRPVYMEGFGGAALDMSMREGSLIGRRRRTMILKEPSIAIMRSRLIDFGNGMEIVTEVEMG